MASISVNLVLTKTLACSEKSTHILCIFRYVLYYILPTSVEKERLSGVSGQSMHCGGLMGQPKVAVESWARQCQVFLTLG